MRLCRYVSGDEAKYGRIEGETVRPLESAPWLGVEAEGPPLPLDSVTLLAPVEPSKIVCVGLNYKKHAAEFNMEVPKEPVIFAKPVSSLNAPGQPIIWPVDCGRIDYEAELAIVMGDTARKIAAAHALDYVLGYTCLNDVSARRFQKIDGQWYRAKGFDTFCPLGPWIDTEVNPNALQLRTEVNGQVVQEGCTDDLIFAVPEIIAFVSRIMTLNPGDVIATGTPAGVGAINPGDTVTVEVEGIGRLTNPVISE